MITIGHIYKRKVKVAAALFTLGISLFAVSSCSNEEIEVTNGKALTFSITDAGAKATTETRATIDENTMTTKFSVGDKAGVFGVRNGAIVDGLNNVQLTYNINGFWDAAQTVSYSENLADVTFYVYYPYDSSMTIDASSADPFASSIAQMEISRNQSSKKAFEAADIMTSGATTINPKFNSVEATLNHRMALVDVQLPNSSYIFTNDGMAPYVLSKSENPVWKLGDTTVQPYFNDATQSYRLIVRPEQDRELNVTFDNLGQSASASMTTVSQIPAGQYAGYVIDGGAKLTTMTLQVGDYFLSDGNIVGKDSELTAAQKAKVIGIVYKLGTTEAIATASASRTHAMVLGLDDSTNGIWGNTSYTGTSSSDNAAGWKEWYEMFGLEVQKYTEGDNAGQPITAIADLDVTRFERKGYEYTEAWVSVPEPLEIGGITKTFTEAFHANYTARQEACPTPTVATKWFIPSVAEWLDIKNSYETLASSLTTAGGTVVKFDGSKVYWSSNIRSAAICWGFQGKGDDVTTLLKTRNYGKEKSQYRWIMAF